MFSRTLEISDSVPFKVCLFGGTFEMYNIITFSKTLELLAQHFLGGAIRKMITKKVAIFVFHLKYKKYICGRRKIYIIL